MNITTTVKKYVIEKPSNYFYSGFRDKDIRIVAGLGLASIALKDGLGCYMYVKQSLNNKNIPEEKRKFVAALDLANGGLMIIAQVLMFKTISNAKVQAKWFEKLFGKYFSRSARKGYKAALSMGENNVGKLSNTEYNIAFKNLKKNIAGYFNILTSLVAATVLAKRVIVPFIATPLAEKAKGLLGDKKEECKAQSISQKA